VEQWDTFGEITPRTLIRVRYPSQSLQLETWDGVTGSMQWLRTTRLSTRAWSLRPQ
ncbi:hypothetical protein KI387_038189, partial [Taxus chinensis]